MIVIFTLFHQDTLGVKGSHSSNRLEDSHTVPSVKKKAIVSATTAQVASYIILRASLPECHTCF